MLEIRSLVNFYQLLLFTLIFLCYTVMLYLYCVVTCFLICLDFSVQICFTGIHLDLLYLDFYFFVQSLEDSGWLWRCFLHGCNRRRHLPGSQRLSECSRGEFTKPCLLRTFFSFFKPTSYSVLLFQGVGHRLRGSANAVRVRGPQIGGKAVIKVSHSGAGIIC